MLKDPHTYEIAARWILGIGIARVALQLIAATTSAWRSYQLTVQGIFPSPIEGKWQMLESIATNLDDILRSVVLTCAGMAVCLGVAWYLRHSPAGPRSRRAARLSRGSERSRPKADAESEFPDKKEVWQDRISR